MNVQYANALEVFFYVFTKNLFILYYLYYIVSLNAIYDCSIYTCVSTLLAYQVISKKLLTDLFINIENGYSYMFLFFKKSKFLLYIVV